MPMRARLDILHSSSMGCLSQQRKAAMAGLKRLTAQLVLHGSVQGSS